MKIIKISKLLRNIGLASAMIVSSSALVNIQNTLAYSFNIIGNWTGSPDCQVTFYEDDGNQVEGVCDNGSFNHIVRGRYSSSNRINITITRIDPNACETSVKGYIEVKSKDMVKIWQTGWNGCGVRTAPASQILRRVGNQS